jgi:hypothetical protein
MVLSAAVYESRIIRRWEFWRVILVTLITLPPRGRPRRGASCHCRFLFS